MPKEPYITFKEPCIMPKKPFGMPKEPYMLGSSSPSLRGKASLNTKDLLPKMDHRGGKEGPPRTSFLWGGYD